MCRRGRSCGSEAQSVCNDRSQFNYLLCTHILKKVASDVVQNVFIVGLIAIPSL